MPVFKSKNKMFYADCFNASTAFIHKAIMLIGNSEFKDVKNEINMKGFGFTS